jgi:alpha 1,3-glucosidase
MLLSNSICGISFVGSDIPGFFNDPEDEELVVRWYQVAVFFPFYRAHAHHDTKRREPWEFAPEICDKIKKAIELRYSLLP